MNAADHVWSISPGLECNANPRVRRDGCGEAACHVLGVPVSLNELDGLHVYIPIVNIVIIRLPIIVKMLHEAPRTLKVTFHWKAGMPTL